MVDDLAVRLAGGDIVYPNVRANRAPRYSDAQLEFILPSGPVTIDLAELFAAIGQ